MSWAQTQVIDHLPAEIEPPADPSEPTPEPPSGISSLGWDDSGGCLAVGDKEGRIRLLEKNADTGDFETMCQFTSHTSDFDYLKSLEIEPKINRLRFCKQQTHNTQMVLATNDKTIKLWKCSKRKVSTAASFGSRDGAVLQLPTLSSSQGCTHTQRKLYADAHAYHINSLSVNSDGETFLSADDLRINLWNMEHAERSFNVVDMKPDDMEDLVEVITAAEFHPVHCNLFLYSTSRGGLHLADLREGALCDNNGRRYEEVGGPKNRSFFSEIVGSVSDIKFSGDGQYMLTRDYMVVKLWDVRKDSQPLKTLPLHDGLKSRLCDLYENDHIFDKFECSISRTGKHVVCGTYNDNVNVYSLDLPQSSEEDAMSVGGEGGGGAAPAAIQTKGQVIHVGKDGDGMDHGSDEYDFDRKVLSVSCNPTSDCFAAATEDQVFIYSLQ